MMTGKTDSYCNQKFWWLNVDLTRKQQHSCCAATPADIDMPWLSTNSGKLFNTPLLHRERRAMLNNDPVPSCYDNCVRPENQGLISRRYQEQGNIKTHTEIESSPRVVNVIIGTTCNLTCVYCCKQYSSAWLKDIEQSGPYFDTNRFKIFPNDQIKKHFDIQADPEYKLLLDELSLLSPDIIHISGGEPFLYNNLYNLVSASTAKTIKINTGLGVDPVRFEQQINKLKDIENIEILISGETIGKLYELVRYGNEFDKFERNLQTVRQSGLKHTMVSVISNLTVLGIADFRHRYQDIESHFVLCNDPEFLAVNVLDDATKNIVFEQIQKLDDHPVNSIILENIVKPATLQQHKDFSTYIQEFASRRKIALDILPESLIHWIRSA
jgi:wyosine [tRNA(Phe)-imidazoG37] synthetase (radical SAM superfamily)